VRDLRVVAEEQSVRGEMVGGQFEIQALVLV
jgi:hypothetical protein